jgi:hypothetical protein
MYLFTCLEAILVVVSLEINLGLSHRNHFIGLAVVRRAGSYTCSAYDSGRYLMIGKCDRCGMDNVEIMSIESLNSKKRENLCNQCRPADGSYAY